MVACCGTDCDLAVLHVVNFAMLLVDLALVYGVLFLVGCLCLVLDLGRI